MLSVVEGSRRDWVEAGHRNGATGTSDSSLVRLAFGQRVGMFKGVCGVVEQQSIKGMCGLKECKVLVLKKNVCVVGGEEEEEEERGSVEMPGFVVAPVATARASTR